MIDENQVFPLVDLAASHDPGQVQISRGNADGLS
jgi:hypothetical protein